MVIIVLPVSHELAKIYILNYSNKNRGKRFFMCIYYKKINFEIIV